MRYMLDTNTVIYAKNARPESVHEHFERFNYGELCISSIVLAELEYGVCNSSKPEQNQQSLLGFLTGIEIIPFDYKAAMEYGKIRYELKTKGETIGANDTLIAAHAKSLGYTLITNNTKEFERVEGLLLENWA